jgi:phage tail sheath protein FI
MAEYLRPGVYAERVDATAPGITAIRTDVAAFVGIAKSGPLDTPVPVESMRQFQAHFGDFTGQGYLAYAVKAFFENGGQRCWIIRVASKKEELGAKNAEVILNSGTQKIWRIEAANPGAWGNELTVVLRSQRSAQAVQFARLSTPQYGGVSTVAGFRRADLVRLSQAANGGGVSELWRVVSEVDANEKRLYWVHPKPGSSLPYDAVVTGFDRNRDITVENLSYRLLVYRRGHLLATFGDLSLIPENKNYGPAVLKPAEYPVRMPAVQRLPAPPMPVVIRELWASAATIPIPLDIDEGQSLPLSGGKDGLAAITIRDFIGESVSPSDSDIIKRQKTRGIESLNLVDEISIVAVPDIVVRPEADPIYEPETVMPPNPCLKCPLPPEPRQRFQPRERSQELPPVFSDDEIHRVQAALIQHCEERGDRFAILDPPFRAARSDALGLSSIQAWRARFVSTYAALYYPWLKATEPRGTAPVRDIPPSGHVIGQYAHHDIVIGVHKAAANRPLAWAQDVTTIVSEGQHEILNPIGINVIRDELGRGLRIMGARTLSTDSDWRYVNVRRLLLMIRKAVDLSTQWIAFEPNNTETRNKLLLALNGFLTVLWQRGALMGTIAEEAFFVKCDEENNPSEERAKGRLLAQVGVAPSKPFEFVILRVGRQGNELEVTEAGIFARAA